METFCHPDLDGKWARVVDGVVLEMRDPNDGQGLDITESQRYQYAVRDGRPVRRVLPPEVHGDTWLGEDRPPQWEPMEPPAKDSILTAWLAWATAQPQYWRRNGKWYPGETAK